MGASQGDSNLSPTPPNYQNGSKIQTSPDYTMNLPIYSSNAALKMSIFVLPKQLHLIMKNGSKLLK